MNLLLDFGNTRLKWAISESSRNGKAAVIAERGVLNYVESDFEAWAETLSSIKIGHILFASVVGEIKELMVFNSLRPLGLNPIRFQVSASAGNLKNCYATQNTLGVDRWAAAIGAWYITQDTCLVICAGTATTIDLIASEKNGYADYRGGLILPGIDLMLHSLHQNTDKLPLAFGSYCPFPTVPNTTDDAMLSGAFEATCGAIERMSNRVDREIPWILTGGNATKLQTILGRQARVVEDLVLEGLATNSAFSE